MIRSLKKRSTIYLAIAKMILKRNQIPLDLITPFSIGHLEIWCPIVLRESVNGS